jgi:fibronectin type 3 domain-containing protein
VSTIKYCLVAFFLSVLGALAFPSFDAFTSATAAGGTSYAAGAGLWHQTNAFGESWAQWSGANGSATAQVTCVASNLPYAAFPAGFPAPPADSAVSLPGTASAVAGYGAALQFSRVIAADPRGLTTNKIYASFLMQIPALGNLSSSSPIYFGGFATNTGDQSISLPSKALKLFLKGNSATVGASTSYSLGIQNASGTGAAAAYDGGGHGSNDVLFVVVDYEFGIDGAPDVANLWINPAGGSFGVSAPPASTATFTTSTATAQLISAADCYLLARSGATLWGSLLVGDLRVGDSWSYVTGAPEILTGPASQTNQAGSTVVFTVNAVAGATNVSPLVYQWEFDGANLANGGNISGANSSTFTLSGVNSSNAGTYSVVVANSLLALTNSAVLAVTSIGLTTNPMSQAVAPGGSATFFVAAAGLPPFSYQWQENGTNLTDGAGPSGTLFSGSHASTLQLANISYSDSGAIFTCAVTNGADVGLVSASATLTVGDPVLISVPQSVTTNFGSTASFTVAATGSGPLTYQWQDDGINLTDGPSPSGAMISGSSTTNLVIAGVGYGDAGNYSVVVYNAHGASVGSPTVPLTVLNTSAINTIDYLNVKTYGARGDGVTDDTAAFLSAIAAAESQNHSGVYVPMGHYVISSTLTLNGCELIGKFAGGWPADTMPLPTLLIRQYTAPGLALVNGASLHGLAIDYDQQTPATTNAPAISVQDVGITLSSLRIVNPYDGITCPASDTPGRARYSDILILQPTHVGIAISKCYDFVQYRHIEVRCPGAMSTGAAFRFGRVDEGGYVGLVASNCATGFELFEDYDSGGGIFTGGFAGCSAIACGTAVSAIGDHKLKISGGDFTAQNYGLVINGTNAEIIINGGNWQVANYQAIQVAQGANVIIDAGIFSRPGPMAATLAQIQNCTTATIKDCQFLPGSTGLELDGLVQRAVVVGNSFEDGGITNEMTSGLFVIAANLFTASPPPDLTVTPGNGQLLLSWIAPLGATSYNLKRSPVSGGSYTMIASLAATNYTDTAVTNGTTYYYVVSAVRTGSESANSAEVSGTPQIPAPLPPADLTATAGNGQVILTWADSTGATNYNVQQSLSSSGPFASIAVTNLNSFTNTGLTNGVTYYYVVSALNMGGASTNSNVAAATPQSPLPAVPTGLTATEANEAVVLNWNTAAGATGYYVKRSRTSGGPYALIAEPASPGWTDLIVTNFTPYFYVVSSVNEAGQSANSAEVSVTPQPSVPLGVVLAGASGQISLSWPDWATNYSVYTTTNLGAPVWQMVTNRPESTNGVLELSLPPSGNAQQFYRLVGP